MNAQYIEIEIGTTPDFKKYNLVTHVVRRRRKLGKVKTQTYKATGSKKDINSFILEYNDKIKCYENLPQKPSKELNSETDYDVSLIEQRGLHCLYMNGMLWMSDSKSEIISMKHVAKEAFGKVLVGGLGLGLVQKFMLNNPQVESVTTIEVVSKVAEIAKRFNPEIVDPRHKIVIGDYYNYCSKTNEKFDYVFCDIFPDWLDQKTYKKVKTCSSRILKPEGVFRAWLL